MRHTLAWLTLTPLAVALMASPASARVRVTVTPHTGNPGTQFVARFRAPERTGRIGTLRRTDRVYVSGTAAAGCESGTRFTLRPARRGARVVVRLRPRAGTQWCAGTHRVRVVRTEHFACPGACRLTPPRPRTVVRWSFTVVRPAVPPPAGAGPAFGGVTTATLCRGGTAHAPTPMTSYTLGWNPASDSTTPSSQIVYEIFYAASPGAENYSSPLATTAPGATGYSGELPGSGPAYFVVRARDGAGRVDGNTVERQAVNAC